MLIIGNLTPDGYLDQPLEEIAEEAGVPVEFAEAVLKKCPGAGPAGRGRAQPAGVPAAPGHARGRRRRRGDRHHHQAPGQPGEEELRGHRQGPEPAARRDLRGGQGPHAVRPQAGAGLHRRGAGLHHAGRLHPQGGRQVLRGGQRRRPAQAEDLRLLPGRPAGGAQGQGVHPGAAAQRPVADPVDPAAAADHRAGDRVDPEVSSASSSTRDRPT